MDTFDTGEFERNRPGLRLRAGRARLIENWAGVYLDPTFGGGTREILAFVVLLIVFATTVSCAQSSGDPAADSQRTSPRAEAGDESRQIQVAESAKTKDDWTVEYEKMGSVLELSAAESTNLNAAFQSP